MNYYRAAADAADLTTLSSLNNMALDTVTGGIALIGIISIISGSVGIFRYLFGSPGANSLVPYMAMTFIGGAFLAISSKASGLMPIENSDDTAISNSTTEPTTPPPTNTPPENNTPTEPTQPMDWSLITNVLVIVAIVVVALIIVTLLYIRYTSAKIKKMTARQEAERIERENPTIRFSDLRGRLAAHHNGVYTDTMIHNAHKLMITAPAFFDVTLPEAIAFEQVKHTATDALDGWSDTTVASAEHIGLVEKVFTTWTDLVDSAHAIGLQGLSPRDITLVKKYTEALLHGGLSTHEHELYLSNLIKLYDKIHYDAVYTTDADSGSYTVKREFDLHLDGRAITSHKQFTVALTTGAKKFHAIEK